MAADIVIEDREGQPVLHVEVKGVPAKTSDLSQLLAEMNASVPAVPFGMLVDPDSIRIVEADCTNTSSFVASFPAAEVLGHYTTHFEESKTLNISPAELAGFLTTLVAVWLDDLMFPFWPGEPPKKKELMESGILPRIAGGTKIERRMLCDDPLHRDQLSYWRVHGS